MSRPALRRFALAVIAALLALATHGMFTDALAAQWGSAYGDPFGFCPYQSQLPGSYATVVTNDPFVGNNPEQDTFWGIHSYPGYDDWYGYWYGDFAGNPGDDSGWHYIGTSYYGQAPLHWNFASYGWSVHGHAKQYIGYYNWTFGGDCGYGWYGSNSPAPYMADVYGNPVVDIYVDSVPPYPPQPRVTAVDASSVTFSWNPVADRGDGSGADYWASGFDHFLSWATVGGGAAQQTATSSTPRTITVSAGTGQTACVHVIAYDALANATGDQQACGSPIAAPPMPPPPPAGSVGLNPWPLGLAGVPAWAWLSPAPSAVTTNESAGGYTYHVTATPSTVDWSFCGDGAVSYAEPAGNGNPYPTPSSVTHTYRTANQAGCPVQASVVYALTYTVDTPGGTRGPYPMAPQTVTYPTVNYPVRQAQPELTRSS